MLFSTRFGKRRQLEIGKGAHHLCGEFGWFNGPFELLSVELLEVADRLEGEPWDTLYLVQIQVTRLSLAIWWHR